MSLFKKKKTVTGEHSLTLKEARCLLDIQKALKDQKAEGIASPAYYVITASEKVYGIVPGLGDGVSMKVPGKEEAARMIDGLDNICRYISEELLADIAENKNRVYMVRYNESENVIKAIVNDFGETKTVALKTANDLQAWFTENGCTGYTFSDYAYHRHIVPGTLFLTKPAADQHLDKNRDAYPSDAKVEGYTAWRSPEFETLITTLREADFEILSEIAEKINDPAQPTSNSTYFEADGRQYVYDGAGCKHYIN